MKKSGYKYYKNINELPIFNFDVINRTHEYQYLMKDYEEAAPPNINLERLWIKIYDEFLDRFGLSEKYEDWMRIKVEAVRLYREAYIDGQRHLRTLAKVKWLEADELMQGIEMENLSIVAARLSKYMGFGINIMTTSVSDFYSFMKVVEMDNKSKTA